jgi:hypothetical protein
LFSLRPDLSIEYKGYEHESGGDRTIDEYGGKGFEGREGDMSDAEKAVKAKTYPNSTKIYGNPSRKAVNQLDLKTGKHFFHPVIIAMSDLLYMYQYSCMCMYMYLHTFIYP